MNAQWFRRTIVLASALAAVGMPFAQYAGVLGLTAAEFSEAGSTTLRAAGYAFAIWGPIYAGLLAYGIYQFIPGLASEPLLKRFAWPSVVACLSVAAWLVAAGGDLRWATVALIALGAFSLIVPLLGISRTAIRARDAWLVVTPLSLLAGWLTLATGLNTLVVLTLEGVIQNADANFWALSGLAICVAVASLVFMRSRAFAYPLPVIWGLIAVFVAERAGNPLAAWASIAAAIGLAGLTVFIVSRKPKASELSTAHDAFAPQANDYL